MKGKKIVLASIVLLAVSAGSFFLLTNKNRTNRPSFTPPTQQKRTPREICLTNEEYAKAPNDAPKLSIPFHMKDFSDAHWGFIPFCAHLKNVNENHNAFDFELKPNSPILASADGVVEYTLHTDAVGAGDILKIIGDGFSLDYSGLTRLQVSEGQRVKKGELLGYAFRTPFDEYHVHLGIFIDGNAQCPIKYMDAEFRAALDEILAVSDFTNYTDAPCACNCEIMVSED